MSDLYGIIKSAHLTEKGDQLQESHGKVVIKVDSKANKIQIKDAVEKIFNVKVGKVHTVKVHRKQKRLGRHIGYTSDWKKAIITLTEGKINFLEEL